MMLMEPVTSGVGWPGVCRGPLWPSGACSTGASDVLDVLFPRPNVFFPCDGFGGHGCPGHRSKLKNGDPRGAPTHPRSIHRRGYGFRLSVWSLESQRDGL